MDRPPPDPAKLLDIWMRWERGDDTPGRIMADLKTAGMRETLEHLANPASITDPGTGTGT
ncbi:MAG: hypothetical protein ACLFRV_07670 [Acidimicrobiales bacterium]